MWREEGRTQKKVAPPLPEGLLATGAPLLSLPLPTTLPTILTCSPTPHCPLLRDQEAAPQDIPAPHRGLQFPLQCTLVVSARSGVSLRPPFWREDSLLIVNCLLLTDSLSSCNTLQSCLLWTFLCQATAKALICSVAVTHPGREVRLWELKMTCWELQRQELTLSLTPHST